MKILKIFLVLNLLINVILNDLDTFNTKIRCGLKSTRIT